jgi:copper homeostasis protein
MIVPGFNNRYPKGDDDYLWSFADCRDNRHAGPDPASDLIVESCCTTLDEALSAEARGADRIELCTDLAVGGVTPPRDLIREVVDALAIPVNVLIRFRVKPGMTQAHRHAGLDPASEMKGFSLSDFVYDEDAIEQMVEDIDFCKSVGAAGIVVGALTPEGAIDVAAIQRLIAAARPLPVTFHRAFDVCTLDPFDALETIISLGCTRLLTSGMAENAWAGRELIARLVQAAGDRLIILAGRGVNPENVNSLAAATGAREFHGTALP